ncbi:MAG: thiolase C-terminal domain-containing protein [Steroidobacteraceae bacterium]
MRSAYVLGVGMTPFRSPRNSPNYVELAGVAAREALRDAGLHYTDVQQVFTAYVYGDSCSGHRAVYEIGMTGVPIFNVNSNCSSGASALYLARQAVASGALDIALVLGFEQMPSGALVEYWKDRPSPLQPYVDVVDRRNDDESAPLAPKLFGAAGKEYCDRYEVDSAFFAAITMKSRHHAKDNYRAIFREPLSAEQVLSTPLICSPLTRAQCCPPTCGAAAAVIVGDSVLRKFGAGRSVRISGQSLETDLPSSFTDSAMDAVGFGIGRIAAERAYDEAGISPGDVDVAELHDCFTVNEVLAYEALGLCKPGGSKEFIESGDNTYGGRCVTNPSGGLLAKGHPLGATGLAQCFELVTQLRGEAQERQVEGAGIGVAHNVGLGSSCIVSVYQRTT